MGEYVALAARISGGLLAGLYLAFAVAVMPALHGLADAAFVDTMRRVNVSIVNPAFLLLFFAAPALAVAAAGLTHSPVTYTAAALGIITLAITLVVSVPLNDNLAAGGSRAGFETRWVLFNALRTLTGIGSFVGLLLSRS